jgi:hypothetical protein
MLEVLANPCYLLIYQSVPLPNPLVFAPPFHHLILGQRILYSLSKFSDALPIHPSYRLLLGKSK